MDNSRPIFIVGCPRSGTTLLSVLLHAHPHIAMPPETRFLLPAYYGRAQFGDLRDSANRRRLAEQITGRGTSFRDLRLDRAAVIEAIVAAPPTLGSALATVWREFARSRGKPRWGEKRPAYWRELDVVRRLFPTAQIIHLVRDPRACVASLAQVPWWHHDVERSTALWGIATAESDRFGKRLPADTFHRVFYEDLVRDVRGTLTELCEFLGEDFAEEMLEHAGAAQDIVPKRKTWHGRVGQDVDPARVEGWRKTLSPDDIGLVELVSRRQMGRYGYRRSDAAARPQAGKVAAAVSRKAVIRAWLTKRRLTDAQLRRRVPMPLAAEV
ncbi:MAG TPA: sulfotransferase [Jatrophihabitans sp.]|nr:sulfotransferase [Jatrophihabitans sp.]